MTDIETLKRELDYIESVKQKVDKFFHDEIFSLQNQIYELERENRNEIIAEWIQRGKDGLNKNINENTLPDPIKYDLHRMIRAERDTCCYSSIIDDQYACRTCSDNCRDRAYRQWREKYNF